MTQALAALAGAFLTVAACYGLGALLVDRLGAQLTRPERFPLAFLLGAACLHLAVFAILTLHIGYWPVLVALLLGSIGAAVAKGSWRVRGKEAAPLSKALKIFSVLLFGVYSILYFFYAWAPEHSADGSGYHLALVARYLRDRGFARITTNFYASLSQGLELLFVPAFAIGRHSAAALVHLSFAAALAILMIAYGRTLGKPWVGVAGAFFTFASPVVGIDASSAYNDVAVGAVVFAAYYWLQVWDDSRNDSMLIPLGLMSGYAYAVKYTAFLILPLALVFVAYRARRLKPLAVTIGCSLVMVLPWMAKDWIEVRNPVAPVANAVFRNPYMHIADEQTIERLMQSYDVSNKWSLPLEVTIRGQKTQGLLGPIFLAVPLALLALRERAGRRLVAAGLVLLAGYFTNIGTRFLIPCVPFFSLAMALPFGGAAPLLASMMIFHAAASWPPFIETYAPNVWRLDKVRYREALRIIPQDKFLREIDGSYGQARMIDANVPKSERVYAPNGTADSYTSREVLVSFRSAWTQVLADALDAGWDPARQSRVLETFSFPERTVRRIRVLQNAEKSDDPLAEWSVNELRILDRGAELPRRPEWRLRAWPNPSEVQLAFDNSPATRWRTWEAIGPGDYIDVDLGAAHAIDQVNVETSYEYHRDKLVLQAMDDHGAWVDVATKPAISAIPLNPNIRRQATDFLKSQGIHYLFIQDQDFEAEDIRDDPEGWGLTRVAKGYGSAIYRID